MRITVDVKADSREEGVEELGEGHFLVRVKAPRRKGKANVAVLKVLRRHFGRHDVILKGHTSTSTIVEIEAKAG